MGLIKCPDCGKEFSDRIEACPVCACPTSEAIKEMEKKDIIEIPTVMESEDNSLYTLTKTELMSSSELKKFVVSNILPIVMKEMNVEEDSVILSLEDKSADVYIKKNNVVTGIVFRISVAPNKYYYINYERNKSFINDMQELGYEYAYANVSLGAENEKPFNRRVVLKNKPYIFQYKKLMYPDFSKDNVIYSLSPETTEEQRSKAIYCEREENASSLKVLSRDFDNRCTADGLSVFLKKYEVDENLISSLSEYLHTLMIAISNVINEERLVLTFLNCVDFCNGIFLSDSKKIEKELIIPTCFELLATDETIDLSEYKMYTFAYYIYHYLETKGRLEPISVNEMNRKKVSSFENNPRLFGFMSIPNNAESKEEQDKTEEKMNYIKTVAKDKVIAFAEAYETANGEQQLREVLDDLLPLAQELRDFFFNHALSDNEIEKISLAAYGIKNVIEADIGIIEKAKNGSYGYFEKRKDQKEKTEKYELYSKHMKALKS